jgi:hypothetical protein
VRRNALRPLAIETTLRQETNMRKIIVATFTSLDGVMQAPGGPQEDPPSPPTPFEKETRPPA